MNSTLQERIDTMLKRDVAVGISFAAAMWLTLLFVFVVTARVVEDRGVVLVLLGSALVLGVFNTLSLLSLVSRYRNERQHVYGEDIAHLDAIKAAQQSDRAGAASR